MTLECRDRPDETGHLALAYVIAAEQQMTCDLAQRDKLAALVDKLLSGASGELSGAERRALADLGRFRGCRGPTAAQ